MTFEDAKRFTVSRATSELCGCYLRKMHFSYWWLRSFLILLPSFPSSPDPSVYLGNFPIWFSPHPTLLPFPFFLYALFSPRPGEWEARKGKDLSEGTEELNPSLQEKVKGTGAPSPSQWSQACLNAPSPGTCPKGLLERLDQEIHTKCLM